MTPQSEIPNPQSEIARTFHRTVNDTTTIHRQEIEELAAIIGRAKAPLITYSESIDVIRDRANHATREHLNELLDRIDAIAARLPQ